MLRVRRVARCGCSATRQSLTTHFYVCVTTGQRCLASTLFSWGAVLASDKLSCGRPTRPRNTPRPPPQCALVGKLISAPKSQRKIATTDESAEPQKRTSAAISVQSQIFWFKFRLLKYQSQITNLTIQNRKQSKQIFVRRKVQKISAKLNSDPKTATRRWGQGWERGGRAAPQLRLRGRRS